MAHRRKVARLVYRFAASQLNRHLRLHAAPNSQHQQESLLKALLHLALEGRYAESGLEDLSATVSSPERCVPSADTLLRRLEEKDPAEVYRELVAVNDSILRRCRRSGIFRQRSVAAVDYVLQPYYGEPTVETVGGKPKAGARWFFCHATLNLVEAGRRLTVYDRPVKQLDEKADVVEELVREAGKRQFRPRLLLLDRGFFTAQVINRLNRLRAKFIIPATQYDTVKEAVLRYSRGLGDQVSTFTLGKREAAAVFTLAIYPKPIDVEEAKRRRMETADRYLAFATNLPVSEVRELLATIPREYRKRWGIETGYRVQKTVRARTTSRCYVVRLVYQMLAVVLYNLWQLVNIMLSTWLEIPFIKPLIKLSTVTRLFNMLLLGSYEPP